jgi:major membrane immunogen (membrane-anchored lipoprotein)
MAFKLKFKEKRIESMNKMTIAIAICAGITLTACGKSSDTESSDPTTASDPMSEQSMTLSEQQTPPADISAETGSGSTTQSEQAAFEADNTVDEKGEMIEGTNKN